ncbi:TPA: hypothetical protein LQP14_001903 [Staphylococcus pseudintermedius]|nr:hypothetical protein [Staphylococcus pseudintermedius]
MIRKPAAIEIVIFFYALYVTFTLALEPSLFSKIDNDVYKGYVNLLGSQSSLLHISLKVVFFRDDSKTEWRVVVDVLPSLVRSATAEYDSNLLPTQSYVKRRGLNGTIVNRREVE